MADPKDRKYRSFLITQEETELLLEALKLQNKSLQDRDKIEDNEALQFELGEELKKF